jgi:hypothetical protein
MRLGTSGSRSSLRPFFSAISLAIQTADPDIEGL